MPPTNMKIDRAEPKSAEKRKRKKKKRKRSNKGKNVASPTGSSADSPPVKTKKTAGAGTAVNESSNADSTALDISNPLLDAHQKFLKDQCTPNERDNFFSNALLDPDRRAELWMEQADVGEALVNQYAWAIPDQRAIRILKHFSPLVEVGCGANAYWARLLSKAGVDIVAFDQFPQAGGRISQSQKNKKKHRQDDYFQVQKGGPEVLSTKKVRNSGRTLFLCYSDEEGIAQNPPPSNDSEDGNDNDSDEEDDEQMTSLGTECLNRYTGDYLIHVGELYGDTTSMEQAPWGRSSGAAFQQQLAATFHCVLRVSLPNWIHVRDTISVWKRSETCSIVFAADSDDEDDEGDMEVEYRHIPASERLPIDLAAPCLAHLLGPSAEEGDENNVVIEQKVVQSKPKQAPQKGKKQKAAIVPAPSRSDNESESSDSEPVENRKKLKTIKKSQSPKAVPPKKKQKVTPKLELSSSDSGISEDEILPLNDENEGQNDYAPEW